MWVLWYSYNCSTHIWFLRHIILPNLTFYLTMRGFNITFAMGAASQQRTLTPPDTVSCPTLGLAFVLMSRPISSELVLFLDFWVLNINRYFSFLLLTYIQCTYCVQIIFISFVRVLSSLNYRKQALIKNKNTPYNLLQNNNFRYFPSSILHDEDLLTSKIYSCSTC